MSVVGIEAEEPCKKLADASKPAKIRQISKTGRGDQRAKIMAERAMKPRPADIIGEKLLERKMERKDPPIDEMNPQKSRPTKRILAGEMPLLVSEDGKEPANLSITPKRLK